MHFCEWKVLYFDWNFKFGQASNWQVPIIGLDNAFASNRRQAIIWTNADLIRWRMYTTLGGDEIRDFVRNFKGYFYIYFWESKSSQFGIKAVKPFSHFFL